MEHGWSKITQLLSGVVLPNKLVGGIDNVEETEDEEEEELSDEVYDQGIQILTNLMEGETFDGYPIQAVPVPCNKSQIEIDGKVYKTI